MIKHARGLVCVPMLGKRLDELKLPLMTKINTEFTKCAFTVSVRQACQHLPQPYTGQDGNESQRGPDVLRDQERTDQLAGG